MKKKVHCLLKDESAAELIEAAIIYPVVILFLFFLIYIGLYIMQNMTVAAYSEKVAMLAAREVAHPGYLDMFVGGSDVFSNSAVEGDYGEAENANGIIKLSSDNGDVALTAYRYWTSNPLGKENSSAYEGILRTIVQNNSILASEGTVDVKVTCENAFITQYINVEVSQRMMDFPVLTFFGIESPTVTQSTKASVSDTDEFIRNINFAADAIDEIAARCGVDTSKLKSKVKEVKDFIDKI